MIFILVLLLSLLCGGASFSCQGWPVGRGGALCKLRWRTGLSMVSNAADDALASIRAKMQANPNYNPLTDPEAAAALDTLVPDYMKEIPNAIERLKTAFQDATTGANAIADLDSIAAGVVNKRELISSPQSDLFNHENKKSPDPAELRRLVDELRQQYPEIPYE